MKQKKIIKFPSYNYRIAVNGKKKLYYCSKCKKVMEELETEECNYYSVDGEIHMMQNIKDDSCPNCGHNAYALWLRGRNAYVTSELKTATIFVDEDKVTVSLFYIHPWINTRVNKVAFKHSSQRITFNTKTGQTYEMPQKCGNKKVIPVSRPLANVTYRSFLNVPREIVDNKELCAAVQEVVAPHINEPLTLEEIKLANRLPQLTGKQLKGIMVERAAFDKVGAVFTKVKKDDTANVFLEKVCKSIKVENNKSIRKLMLDGNFNVIKLTRQLGFKDVNHVRGVVELLSNYITDNVKRYQIGHVYDIVYNNNGVHDFINDVINVKGESGAVKLLQETLVTYESLIQQEPFWRLNGNNMLEITARNWKGLVEVAGVNFDKEGYLRRNLKGGIGKLNDEVRADINKFMQKNVHKLFEYTKKELGLEYSNEEFDFHLAKSKANMIDCGKSMRICVGEEMYTGRAARKDIYIIIVTDKSNKFKCCIELGKDLSLYQVKTFGNGCANGNLAEAVREWVKLKGIKNPDWCTDYVRMDQPPVKRANENQVQQALQAFDDMVEEVENAEEDWDEFMRELLD